ncbi:MAG: HDIG domain-containing protein [Candidatus Pacebacteria bacterium]|nr:HDIG domain-containing protein [Candidatus Paceibacterota bacterium]
MNREKALEILKQNVQNKNLIKHCLAVESVMQVLACHFSEDQEKWKLAGLLHDIDYEETKDSPEKHSLVGAEMLKELGVEKDICQAVKAHNEAHGEKPETLMEKTLFVSDPITGLIVASTLVLPSKKLADLTVQNVLNRFKEKAFARGANREIISKCEEYLNLNLKEFIKIVLNAMQSISDDLEL